MPDPVLVDDFEVVPALVAMKLPREILLDILERALGEWARVNTDDPVETGLYEMRRWVTRYLRTDPTLSALGWKSCKVGQIEGIRHDEIRIKFAFLNTDQRTGVVSKRPSNVSKKGPRTEYLADRNCATAAPDMFGYTEGDDNNPVLSYDFWCFCAFVSDDLVAAEVSRPIEVASGFVRGFSKRIMLVQPGEWSKVRSTGPVPEEFAAVEMPTVSPRA